VVHAPAHERGEQHGADADDEPDVVDGDGLTFEEFQELLRWRRGISTSLR
jgi:hypothetical protein